MDRTAFLGRIRTALRDVAAPPLPDDFPPTPASGEGADRERFLAALTATGGTGTTVAAAGLADAVSAFASTLIADDGPTPTSVVAPDVAPFADAVDAGLRSAGMEPVRPDEPGSWRTASADAVLGVTSARLGVTSTGSVLIVSGADSPRSVSILPTAHLVLLPVERLVDGLEDVMPVLASVAATSSSPFLVTGPSRTSDIEMVTVMGVHGPRAVHVVLIEPDGGTAGRS
jgi:L-lactate dehydrogenase complex protein LldG